MKNIRPTYTRPAGATRAILGRDVRKGHVVILEGDVPRRVLSAGQFMKATNILRLEGITEGIVIPRGDGIWLGVAA